uniref:Heat shock protein 70 n=1 Tax=Solibacter usitatus (strain Ellin6076) TaxID=234267 RepID=Q01SX4_SOLUE
MSDLVVGIDLGTTNSEVAAFLNGRVRVLGPNASKMLPSCVGISPSGELMVGEAALNQQRIYPERTVRSIKRKMGSAETVMMAGKGFSPAEISALILKELAAWAERDLGRPVERAVITVPAYFSDAQRNATREAGMLAGLEVVRILNEPTAASLAYGFADGSRHTVMVYDLGGGTFDVSIVTIEGEVTEVLSSHGNNRLGGDDFDDLLAARLEREFLEQHGIRLAAEDQAARARLWWAAETAKKQLSFEPYARVREEALVVRNGKPYHLDLEISREEYEGMILPLVESTLDSVSQALDDAGKSAGELDAILLVGGSTRTPLVAHMLRARTGLDPRQDVHPDLSVALGAGVLASRLAGREVERVLVDVSPYSFGPSYLGERGGVSYPHCYHPLIRRNTPLPVTRTESYYTSHPGQTVVEIQIFQGDDEDALNNLLVGDFKVEGLTWTEGLNEVLCRMSLDVEGILHVSAIEKRTGKSKQITIAGALQAKSDAEIAAARRRVEELFQTREDSMLEDEDPDEEFVDEESDDEAVIEVEAAPVETGHTNGKAIPIDDKWSVARHDAIELLQRSRALLDRMHAEDREETTALHRAIESAVSRHDPKALGEAVRSLKELLFFVEGA